MNSNFFIHIDNPNLLNFNIIQDNEAINRAVPLSLRLVLANRIIRVMLNEIQANCTIKGGPLGKWCIGFWLHIFPIGDNISQSK